MTCDADQRFDTKVKCPTGWASFWSNSPLYGANLWSNPRGMPSVMGGFGNDLYITKNDFQYSRLLLFGNAHASYLPSKIFKSPCIYLNCTASPSHRTTNIFVIKLHQFVTSLRYTFREALKINTFLSREIPILLFPLYRKRYPLRGGTFSIGPLWGISLGPMGLGHEVSISSKKL